MKIRREQQGAVALKFSENSECLRKFGDFGLLNASLPASRFCHLTDLLGISRKTRGAPALAHFLRGDAGGSPFVPFQTTTNDVNPGRSQCRSWLLRNSRRKS